MKIVVDTNVVVSGLLKPQSNPAEILNLILSRQVVLCADSRIINEYREVLLRDKFPFPKKEVEVLVSYLESIAILISPPPTYLKPKDLGDLPFIEIALHLNVPIVTGNTKHFENLKGIKILTPAEFVKFYKIEPKN